MFSRIEKRFGKESYKNTNYRRLSGQLSLKSKIFNNHVKLKENEEIKIVAVNSINFIPNIISAVTIAQPKDTNKVYYLSALFSLRLLKYHLSNTVAKRMKN